MPGPLLAPHALIAWRDDRHLVVEDPAAPDARVVIGNASPALLRWLRLCNGSRPMPDLLQEAGRRGIAADGARELLEALAGAGLLGLHAAAPHEPNDADPDRRAAIGQDLEALALCGTDASDAYRRRRAHHVWIEGSNRVAHALVDVLAAAHIGSLQVRTGHMARRAVSLRDLGAFGPTADDVGSAPSLAMRRHIMRVGTTPPTGERRPIVIAVDAHLDPSEDIAFQEAGVPYLRVLTGSRYATIGPLTLPGASACWSCLALHRADADPVWPALLAQADSGRRTFAAIDDAFAITVAVEVVNRLLVVIDADDPTSLVNTTLHIDRTLPSVQRRTWRVHQDCPCQWRLSAA